MKILTTFLCLLLLFFSAQCVNAHTTLVSEPVLQQAVRLTDNLPANISETYQQYNEVKAIHDSLEQLLKEAHPTLAGKIKKRSARLNAMVNDNADGATLLLMPPNQKMTSFFMAQWDKMDALEKAFNQAAPSFFGSKEMYGKKGYLAVWDSVYRQRRPALVKYRDGILTLVRTDIAYLKANAKMFTSNAENERMQWVEAELGVLQKLVLLESKYKKLVITDGVEKVEFCNLNPGACTAAKQ
jgi:hypothetical protein